MEMGVESCFLKILKCYICYTGIYFVHELCTPAGPQGAAIAGLGKVERMHTSAIKNMHEHLIKKFPQTFDRCSPGAPMRQHRLQFPLSKLSKEPDGTLDPFEELGNWPPDTTCPNPE